MRLALIFCVVDQRKMLKRENYNILQAESDGHMQTASGTSNYLSKCTCTATLSNYAMTLMCYVTITDTVALILLLQSQQFCNHCYSKSMANWCRLEIANFQGATEL